MPQRPHFYKFDVNFFRIQIQILQDLIKNRKVLPSWQWFHRDPFESQSRQIDSSFWRKSLKFSTNYNLLLLAFKPFLEFKFKYYVLQNLVKKWKVLPIWEWFHQDLFESQSRQIDVAFDKNQQFFTNNN